MVHLNLVGIHPWRDGNGRTARALHTLVLARTGEPAAELSSIEEWLGEHINTVRYFEIFVDCADPHAAFRTMQAVRDPEEPVQVGTGIGLGRRCCSSRWRRGTPSP